MLPDQLVDATQLGPCEPRTSLKANGIEPELGLTVIALDMEMPRFLSVGRIEETGVGPDRRTVGMAQVYGKPARNGKETGLLEPLTVDVPTGGRRAQAYFAVAVPERPFKPNPAPSAEKANTASSFPSGILSWTPSPLIPTPR